MEAPAAGPPAKREERQPCTVCHRTHQNGYGFSYGAYVCNACKQVFRNAQKPDRPIVKCSNGDNNCPRDSKCRLCRYNYCLAAGMKMPITRKRKQGSEEESATVALPSPNPRSPTTSKYNLKLVIGELMVMDGFRRQTFNTQVLLGDLSLDEVILTDFKNLKLTPRAPDFQGNFYDWATMDQISAINFMKKFEFVKNFTEKELKHFVKRSYVRFIMLITGWRNMKSKKAAVEYPGNVDVFPDEVKKTTMVHKSILEKVRCELVAKMRELKVTKEEFLLMAGLIICDPYSVKLTKDSSEILSKNQRFFGSCLMQYCMIKYGSGGPVRYTNLLGLHATIIQNFEDFGNVWIPYLIIQQPKDIRKMFSDFKDLMTE